MKGKRGWIRILEATIAVLIVSGAMLAVYSQQPSRDESIEEYSYSLQQQILADISSQSDLRLAALKVEDDISSDANYEKLDEFVAERIPDAFGYSLRVCELGDVTDFCKMDGATYSATMGFDVFVEDVVIGAELGEGEGEEVYSPKKVRLFFWEGGFPPEYCKDECSVEGTVLTCSDDSTWVASRTCGDFDDDECLEYDGEGTVVDSCTVDEVCVGAECVYSPYSEWVCEGKVIVKSGSGVCFDDECNGYDGGHDWGCNWWGCSCDFECWNFESVVTDCELNPSCPAGYDLIEKKACVGAPLVAELSATITMTNVVKTWDSAYSCYYNKCNYDVSVSNSGNAAGIIWKRVGVTPGDTPFEKIYNQVVSHGISDLVIDTEGFANSKCLNSLSYDVRVYDDLSNDIGGHSFTCPNP